MDREFVLFYLKQCGHHQAGDQGEKTRDLRERLQEALIALSE
jgi:hypothetical protein